MTMQSFNTEITADKEMSSRKLQITDFYFMRFHFMMSD